MYGSYSSSSRSMRVSFTMTSSSTFITRRKTTPFRRSIQGEQYPSPQQPSSPLLCKPAFVERRTQVIAYVWGCVIEPCLWQYLI